MAHPHPLEGDGTRDERYKTREMTKLERRLFCGQKTEFPSMASWVAALEMELMGPQDGGEFPEFGSLQGMPKLDAYMYHLEHVKIPILEYELEADPMNIMSLYSLSVRLAQIEHLCFGPTNDRSPFYKRFAKVSSFMWGHPSKNRAFPNGRRK